MSTTQAAVWTRQNVAIRGGAGYPQGMIRTTTAKEDWAEAAEARILDAALPLAPVAGWSRRTVNLAALKAGLSEADAALLLPNGASDLAALLSRRHDAAARQALAGVDPRNLKVRERIQRGVMARVEAAAADSAAVRRLLGFLALPSHLALGARLLWDSSDAIWRWAGDTATDENHYSKRVILSGVLGPAIALRMSSGRDAAEHYVFSRINDVMAFEKWKAGLPKTDVGGRIAGVLGRLRYGKAASPAP
ncbi:MAG: rpsU-divergently transcribed protein [Caulobacteraceae bacterium]|nr:rpsU-divergently transcribed protein [Caulobacteraceae bacterium]